MIRHLLVPTDFSSASLNSVQFAIELARQIGAEKLFILHAYHVPVSTIETAYMADQALMLEQAEKIARTEMGRLESEVLIPANIAYECITQVGPALEEINQLVEDKAIHMVVMASHKMSRLERFFGSLTTHAIENCEVPVLVVPEEAYFKPFRNLLFATDLKHIPYRDMLPPLNYLVKAFGAQITLFNVNPEYNQMDETQIRELEELRAALADTEVKLEFSEEKGREMAILNFMKGKPIDLLVVVPHHHNFFDELLRNSLSKKLALHSTVPLLALHA